MPNKGYPVSDHASPFTVVFPDWYDERAEFEHFQKGYLPDVEVRLEDGSRYRLYFYEPVRFWQDFEKVAARGKPYLAEPGLVVIPEITRECIRKAVAGLWQDDFFRHLRPVG